MTTNDAPVTVEQCDRDAAALLIEGRPHLISSCQPDWCAIDQKMFRDGRKDEHPFVQAFARHRLAALASAPAGDAIEAAARAMCDRVNGIGDYDENIQQRRPGWTAQAKAGLEAAAAVRPPAGHGMERITRDQYPEIIQAARWMDEDHGTPHFEPGIGFIVDDPEGLTVPARWLPHLPTIEAALAKLDHAAPHPLDVDTIEWLARERKEPTLYESAAHCFVSGEHTPMQAMADSSEELWIASRFLTERCESWAFDPAAGFEALARPRATVGEREE